MSTDIYSLSNLCQYLTLYRLLLLCHFVHCHLLRFCQLSVRTSHCIVYLFCVSMSNDVFENESTFCHLHTLYGILFLCHYVQCCLLQTAHCLSLSHFVPSFVLHQYDHYCLLKSSQFLSAPHIVRSIGSVCLCPLLSSTVCPLYVNPSHCTACLFCVTMSTAVFYSLSTDFQYLTLYHLFALCHYAH